MNKNVDVCKGKRGNIVSSQVRRDVTGEVQGDFFISPTPWWSLVRGNRQAYCMHFL